MIVAADGSGDFLTVQQAIDSIAPNNQSPITICVKNGVYHEKIYIEKPFIKLLGEDAEKTILSYNDHANKRFEDGSEYGTFNSYSTLIHGAGFEAENITFQNSAGPGSLKGQALAVYVDADRVNFLNCRFLGHQDTIFTGPLPPSPMIKNGFKGPQINEERRIGKQHYENCYIEGDVDFIFGSAIAVFQHCTIKSLDRGEKEGGLNGYVTAASTPEGLPYGYVFLDCKLISNCAPDSVYLGRPWRNFAKTVFIRCYMDAHIKKVGWHNWNKPECEQTILYAEYNSYGPGGNMEERVPWAKFLTPNEAESYTVENILG